jgi:hypothetical protein
VALVLFWSVSAVAGWLTIKNDTNKAIVVQETIVSNGQVRRGRPTNLLPGETLREFIPCPTTRRVEVFEARNPTLPVWSGELDCKAEKQLFSVAGTTGKVTVTACPTGK